MWGCDQAFLGPSTKGALSIEWDLRACNFVSVRFVVVNVFHGLPYYSDFVFHFS
jgi:hypothetical protein